MKKILPIAGAVALAASLAFPQEPVTEDAGDPDLTARVEALEKSLAATNEELATTRALLEQTVGYLHAQAEASKVIMGALDSSEEAGFVPGINFRSREILLTGLRSWWSGKATGLPPAGAKKTPPGKKPVPARAGG